MAEYIVLAALAPGFQVQIQRVRGKLRLTGIRVFWPWWSRKS